MPIVIADAGPLIALARVDQLALLPALFGEVVVTEAVKTELLAGVFAETALLKAALSARWCKQQPTIATLAERSAKLASTHLIGAGESSAIALAHTTTRVQRLRLCCSTTLVVGEQHNVCK